MLEATNGYSLKVIPLPKQQYLSMGKPFAQYLFGQRVCSVPPILIDQPASDRKDIRPIKKRQQGGQVLCLGHQWPRRAAHFLGSSGIVQMRRHLLKAQR